MVMDIVVDHPGISKTFNAETAYWPSHISGNHCVARSMYRSSCLTTVCELVAFGAYTMGSHVVPLL